MQFINPKIDYAFKKIFGSEQSHEILINPSCYLIAKAKKAARKEKLQVAARKMNDEIMVVLKRKGYPKNSASVEFMDLRLYKNI